MARKRGRGMAACWYGIARTATVDRAGAWVEIDDGGTAKVVTGVTEIGEGILTVLAQIAAQEIGVQPEDVTIGDNDTARSPEAAHAGATPPDLHDRQCRWRSPRAKRASSVAGDGRRNGTSTAETIEAGDRRNLGRGHQPSHHDGRGGASRQKPRRGAGRLGELRHRHDRPRIRSTARAGPGRLTCSALRSPRSRSIPITGEVQVLGIWAAHDVGRAVNPQGVEGQIEGGIVQALGQALMEDYKLENGHTTTPGFAKYILPTSLDVPHVTSIIVEDPDPIGPLGVKGIGEPAMVPTIPAIMNAIYDAVGVRITSLPATPEKVLMAIRDKERAERERRVHAEAAE